MKSAWIKRLPLKVHSNEPHLLTNAKLFRLESCAASTISGLSFDNPASWSHVKSIFLPPRQTARDFRQDLSYSSRKCNCNWHATGKVCGIPIELCQRKYFPQYYVPRTIPVVFDN